MVSVGCWEPTLTASNKVSRRPVKHSVKFSRVLLVGCVMSAVWTRADHREPLRAQAVLRVLTQDEMVSITALDCSFDLMASGHWQGDTVAVATATGTALLTLNIVDIDTVSGTALMKTPGGTVPLSARADRSNLYLVDNNPIGYVSVSTVFSQEATPGRLKAVHTTTGPDASQFYGDCAFLK